jgi:hypothetical protein
MTVSALVLWLPNEITHWLYGIEEPDKVTTSFCSDPTRAHTGIDGRGQRDVNISFPSTHEPGEW